MKIYSHQLNNPCRPKYLKSQINSRVMMLILAVIVVILQTLLNGFIRQFCKAGILNFITKSQLTIVQRNELLLSCVPSLAFIAKSHFISIAQCNAFSFQKLESYYVLGASESSLISSTHARAKLLIIQTESMFPWFFLTGCSCANMKTK